MRAGGKRGKGTCAPCELALWGVAPAEHLTRLPHSAAMYFAHAGHWLTSIAYFVPVIGFLVWLAVTQIKERRKG